MEAKVDSVAVFIPLIAAEIDSTPWSKRFMNYGFLSPDRRRQLGGCHRSCTENAQVQITGDVKGSNTI